MSSSTFTVQPDGYSQVFGAEDKTSVSIRVSGPDDTKTWKLQASLEDADLTVANSWWDVEDSAGAAFRQVNARPISFDVSLYNRMRIWVSDATLAYRIHLKRRTP